MAKKRPGMMIYFADWDGVADLLTPEQFKRLFLAVMHASMGEAAESLDDDKTLVLAYRLIQGKMERDAEKYDAVCEKRRAAAGRRWGKDKTPEEMTESPSKADEPAENDGETIESDANDAIAFQAMQTMPTVIPTVIPTVNPTVISLPNPLSESGGAAETGTERGETVPSAADVVEYARAAGCERVDEAVARRFIATQAAKGWMGTDGRPIRDWRTWFDGWYARNVSAMARPAPTSMQYAQRTYTDEELRALTAFMEGDDPDTG